MGYDDLFWRTAREAGQRTAFWNESRLGDFRVRDEVKYARARLLGVLHRTGANAVNVERALWYINHLYVDSYDAWWNGTYSKAYTDRVARFISKLRAGCTVQEEFKALESYYNSLPKTQYIMEMHSHKALVFNGELIEYFKAHGMGDKIVNPNQTKLGMNNR